MIQKIRCLVMKELENILVFDCIIKNKLKINIYKLLTFLKKIV